MIHLCYTMALIDLLFLKRSHFFANINLLNVRGKNGFFILFQRNFQLIYNRILLICGLLIFILFSNGCSGNREEIIYNSDNMYTINITEWNKLGGQRLFFGHQSVGNNILDGIKILNIENNLTMLNIVETKDASDFHSPVFAHYRIGKNYDPTSKIDDFVSTLESGLGSILDIAFMKLCYVDFNKQTDIYELFSYYQSEINRIETKFPDLKIIHCTVPLTIRPQGLKGVAFMILKKDGNVYRNRYNELLRKNYNRSDIFDIAAIESKLFNGEPNLYHNGIPAMLDVYASDNAGHLNVNGQKLLAYHLLKMLISY